MYVLYEFEGRVDTFPKDPKPKKVHMVHPAVGVASTYDPATGKFEFDREKWALAAAMTSYSRRLKWMGPPQWAFPPHVFMVDAMGDPLAIVTKGGRVNFPHFSRIKDTEPRRKAQNEYMDQLAKVLNSTGLLHLYFLSTSTNTYSTVPS